MSDQPRWIWDPDSEQHFFYEARSDTLVFQNGRRVRRPPHIPRTTFTSAASQAAATPSSSSFAQDLPVSPGYVTSPRQEYQLQGGRSLQQPISSQTQARPTPSQYGYPETSRGQSTQVDALAQNLATVTVSTLQSPAGTLQHPQPVLPQVTERDGVRVRETTDPNSHLRTVVQTAPVTAITDPDLLSQGIRAHQRIIPSDNEPFERLFSNFRQRESPRRFFTVGKVFLVLWVEPAGETLVTSIEPGTTIGRFGERVFSKVRRFVVIREGDNYCSALPIATYGQRGVGKPGVNKSEHSIVHTTKRAPELLQAEIPERGEEGMRPHAIRIDADDPTEKLDEVSRLDYGKVHTIQHNIKVRPFGKVNPNSMHALINQFGNVWQAVPSIGQASSSRAETQETAHVAHETLPRTRRESQSSGRPTRQAPMAQLKSMPSNPVSFQRPAGQHEPSEADRAVVVQDHLRREVQRLVQQGYTQERAERAIREAAQRRRAQQAPGQGASREEEEDDEDSSDEDDEDDEDDATNRSSGQRRARSGESQRRGDEQQQRARLSQANRRPSASSQPAPSATRAQAGVSSQSRSSTSTQQPPLATPATSQPSISRVVAPVQSQTQSRSVTASSASQSPAEPQTSTRAQAEALMSRLIREGRTQQEAAAIVRARFGSGRSS